MQHDVHPHDERLAALAADDPEVAGDPALRAHVASCDRCGPMVADLTSLRAALADLPDLAPSRPIQLLPPVREADKAGAGGIGPGWIRRLWAPAMAAGAGLALVGAVGLSGVTDQLASGPGPAAEGAAGFETMSVDDDRGDVRAPAAAEPSNAEVPDMGTESTPVPRTVYGGSASPDGLLSGEADGQGTGREDVDLEPSDEGAAAATGEPALLDSGSGADLGPDGTPAWSLVAAVAGIALMVLALFLRFRVQPRAG